MRLVRPPGGAHVTRVHSAVAVFVSRKCARLFCSARTTNQVFVHTHTVRQTSETSATSRPPQPQAYDTALAAGFTDPLTG